MRIGHLKQRLPVPVEHGEVAVRATDSQDALGSAEVPHQLGPTVEVDRNLIEQQVQFLNPAGTAVAVQHSSPGQEAQIPVELGQRFLQGLPVAQTGLMEQLLNVRHVRVQALHARGDGAGQGRVIGSHRRLPPENRELIRELLLLAQRISQEHQHQRHRLAWDLPVGQVDEFQQLLMR